MELDLGESTTLCNGRPPTVQLTIIHEHVSSTEDSYDFLIKWELSSEEIKVTCNATCALRLKYD